MTREVEFSTELPQFFECGGCSCYHPADFWGDCRDDDNRYTADELDAAFGYDGWEEVDSDQGV